MKPISIFFLLTLLNTVTSADIIILKNGEQIVGVTVLDTITVGANRFVRFQDTEGRKKIQIGLIARVYVRGEIPVDTTAAKPLDTYTFVLKDSTVVTGSIQETNAEQSGAVYYTVLTGTKTVKINQKDIARLSKSAPIETVQATKKAPGLTNADRFFVYGRKETGTGILLSILLPGGGHFYADDGTGILFALGEVGCVVWWVASWNNVASDIVNSNTSVSQTQSDANKTWIPVILSFVLKIVDVATVPSAVESYNKSLLHRVSIGITPRGLTLSYAL